MAADERIHTVLAIRSEDINVSFSALGSFEDIADVLDDFGGQLVRGERGWAVSIFRSATAALDAATSLQILSARPSEHSANIKSRPSMALDLGDLRQTGVGWVGTAVDNAVRIAECAAPGQVLISRAVAALSGSTEHTSERLGAAVAERVGVPHTTEILDWEHVVASEPLAPVRDPIAQENSTVGRSDVLTSLTATVGRAAVVGEGPEFVVIEGCAGSGKSSLLDEVARTVDPYRSAVISGRGRHRALRPLDAFIGAVAPLIEAASYPHLQLWVRSKPSLDSIFPLLAERRAGGSSVGAPTSLGSDPAEDVAAFLLEVSLDMPLVVFIDDADLLDDASMEVLGLLASSAVESRMVVILSGNREASSPEWARLVHRMHDRPGSRVIELAPLDQSDLTLLADVLGVDLSASDVAVLQERSGGVAGHAVDALRRRRSEESQPRENAGADRRLSDLTADARRVAEAAALCGDDFDVDIVGSAIEFSQKRVDRALEELEERSLLRPSFDRSPSIRSLSSDTVRDAIRSSTNGVRLVSLHHRLAGAYAKRSKPADNERFAEHLDRARPLSTAEAVAEAWIAAASWSLGLGDVATARRAAGRGLDSLADTTNRELEARLWLLISRADVADADFDSATAGAAAAADASAAIGKLDLFCEAAAIRIPRRYGEENRTMVELGDRAVARFTDELPLGLRSRVLVARARHERVGLAADLTEQALALARSASSASAVVDAGTERLFALSGWPDANHERRAVAAELLAVPSSEIDFLQRFHLLDAASLVSLESGDRPGFERLFAEMESLAGHSPCTSIAVILDCRRALRDLLDGRWASALEHSSGSEVRNAHPYEVDTIAAQVSWLSLGQGRTDLIENELRRMRAHGLDGDAERAAGVVIAFCLGDVPEARAQLSAMLPIDMAGEGADCFSRSTVLALLGRVAASCGSLGHIDMLLEVLQPRSGSLLTVPGVVVYGPADRLIGALLARIDVDGAFEALDAALTLDRRLQSAPSEARTLSYIAELQQVTGDDAASIQTADAAWEIANELGMDQVVRHLEMLYHRTPARGRWVPG